MRSIICFAFILFSISTTAQTPSYQPYFSAVVVSDVVKAAAWYGAVFDLKEKTRITDPNGAHDIAIMESGVMALELLQLKGSLTRKEILAGKPENTQIQGHFKFGFKVTDMNAWLEKLKRLKVEVPRVYTDGATKKRNFLVQDPDGNLLQFFE
jgi:predicted enzyme related to lactoylglutathione lyase